MILHAGMATLDFLSLVSEFPLENTENRVIHTKIEGGGPAGRSAITTSRLGANSVFCGMIGKGEFANILKRKMDEEGVECHWFSSDNESQYSTNIVSGTERTTIWRPQPRATTACIEQSKILVKSSKIVLLDCTDHALTEALSSYCKSENIATVIDTGSYKEAFLNYCSNVDHIVTPHKFFISSVAEQKKDFMTKALRFYLQYKPKSLVITCGEKGGYYITDGMEEFEHFSAIPITAVDTCGAGDTYHGAYAYALAQGWEVKKSVLFSAWAAGMKVSSFGNSSIPKQHEKSNWELQYK